MIILRWWVSVSVTDGAIMPWHGGYKSDKIGCNEAHKSQAKFPFKSEGHHTGRIHFQVISVSITAGISAVTSAVNVPCKSKLLTIVLRISESYLITRISHLQWCYWMLHDYIAYGPAFFSVNMLAKQFFIWRVQAQRLLKCPKCFTVKRNYTNCDSWPVDVIRFLIRG